MHKTLMTLNYEDFNPKSIIIKTQINKVFFFGELNK